MPLTGFYHFYELRTRYFDVTIIVLMPLTGFYHFYQYSSIDFEKLLFVLMPLTGFYHFYGNYVCSEELHEKCVNALNGLLSFLHSAISKAKAKTGIVLMPLTGFYHFYNLYMQFQHRKRKCVNALNGLLSFLRWTLRTCTNKGFPDPFLQVIDRIF